MNKLYTTCFQCGRLIYAGQAAENGGVCGADCPAGAPKGAKPVPAPVAPLPRERIIPPPEPAPVPVTEGAAPSEDDGEAHVSPADEAPDTSPAPAPEAAPEARAGVPGKDRMHRGDRESRR